MIVKNEEALLAQSLQSIQAVADEIIITDTGSTDNTIKIAKEFTNKVFHFPWNDNFSDALNFCHSHSSSRYNFRWDADFLLRKGQAHIINLKNSQFDHLNTISFTWNIEFGNNNHPIKSIPRWFIFEKSAFHFVFPVHADIKPNDPKILIKNKYYPEIEIDHLKDKKLKAHRYEQTLSLVQKSLKKDKNNPFLLFAFAEELIFEKNFIQAIKILSRVLNHEQIPQEKKALALEHMLLCYLSTSNFLELQNLILTYKPIFFKNPRFQLIEADFLAMCNPTQAIKTYTEYLKHPLTLQSASYLFDYQRHVIHPHYMLGKLLTNIGKINEAIPYLTFVIKHSHLSQPVANATLILESNI